MTLSKGAVGNLVNRYRAVLKKCHLMNVFGSLAVAALITMGGSVALAESTSTSTSADVAYEGETTTDVVGSNKKAIGGWNFISEEIDGNQANTSTNITVTGGKFDEIIGGNHIKYPAPQEAPTNPVSVSIGDTNTTITGTSGVQYIIGGSKATNANVNLSNGVASLTIEKGSNLADGENRGHFKTFLSRIMTQAS